MHRARLSAWLARNADLPLRYVAAPAGAGKTTAIVGYLATRETGTAYLELKDDDGIAAYRARLAHTLGIEYEPASFDALVAALATIAPCEIAFDAIDRAPAETLEELAELVREAPFGVAFIFASRARAAIEAGPFLARGFAAILDPAMLDFDAADVRAIAESRDIRADPNDIGRLLEDTEGWPLAASWAIREADGTLAGAFERWLHANGRHFADYVESELRAAGEPFLAAFRASGRGAGGTDERERLALLASRGLFVVNRAGVERSYRVARSLDLTPAASTARAETLPLLAVRMFGRFEAEIGGRKIAWIRRREAQLFKYLLLKPSGSATRTELLELFWPGSYPRLTTQSLRTATSNIRKALAEIVGYATVEQYFSSRGDIAVALERTVIDVRRFAAHVADGDAERERGRLAEAFAHYRAAENIYSGELLSGEAPEPWYAGRAAMYHALFLGVLERIAEYHADAGHARQAREYGERARRLHATVSA